jgi:hypothetical protein
MSAAPAPPADPTEAPFPLIVWGADERRRRRKAA